MRDAGRAVLVEVEKIPKGILWIEKSEVFETSMNDDRA